jgi:hypothetical protein
MHKKRFTFGVAIVVVAVMICSGLAQTKDEAKSDIPEIILKAFQSEYPEAKITGFEQETVDSLTVFEIECTDGDTKKDVILSTEGKIIQVEQEIAV